MQQRGAGLRTGAGEHARRFGIGREGGLGLGLGAVDGGVGGGVDHHLRAQAGERGADGRRVGKVQRGAGQTDRLGSGQALGQLAAQLAAGAGDENAHAAPG